jgi:hypothetical protein
MSAEEGIAVVRRNTEEVQGRGNFEVFEEIFASDFVDRTPQPGGFTPDRDGARNLYRTLRTASPDFHAEIIDIQLSLILTCYRCSSQPFKPKSASLYSFCYL